MKRKGTIRWLLTLICLAAALCAFAFAARAAEARSGFCGAEGNRENLTWTLDTAGTLTVSGQGAMEDYWTDLFDSIYRTKAPWGWRDVKKIVIRPGVTDIGDNAFAGCVYATQATIPEGVTGIGSSAFRRCEALQSLTLPGSVSKIEYEAFLGCKSLERLTLPEGLTEIGSSAFEECDRLTGVTIPASVTELSSGAFGYCPALTALSVKKDNPVYYSAGNCLIERAEKQVIQGCGSSVIPGDGSVEAIAGSAFSGCASLKKVTLPSSVTSIGAGAFRDCTGLTELTLSDSLTSIPWYAFSGCSALKQVSIPNGVTSIGRRAFAESGLTSFFLPASVTELDWEILLGCADLNEIRVDPANPNYYSAGNCLINKSSGRLMEGSNASVIPDDGSIRGISTAFYGRAGLKEITIPEGITTIGSSTFTDCSGLQSLSLPDTVTVISYCAFVGCKSLAALRIPDSVKTIRFSAFEDCESLSSLSIGSGLTDIDSRMFYGCSGLRSITVDPDNQTFAGAGNCLINKETKTVVLGCADSLIPADGSVAAIGAEAFGGCARMTSVTIPSGVTEIGSGAFAECTGLKSILLPDSVTEVGVDAFKDTAWYAAQPDGVVYLGKVACGYKGTIPKNGAVAIRPGTNAVADRAFADGGLTAVTLPSGLTAIGRAAFSGCGSLASLSVPESVVSVGEDAFNGTAWFDRQPDGMVYAGKVAYRYKGDAHDEGTVVLRQGTAMIGASAFSGQSGLTGVTIPDSVTRIGERAFYRCGSLRTVVIPRGVTRIEASVFSGCESLQSATVPDGVTSIGASAFDGCRALTEADMPGNLKTLGSGAYYNCESLKAVTVPDGVTRIESSAFYGCRSLASVRLPKNLKSIGRGAFEYCKNLKKAPLPQGIKRIESSTFHSCEALTDVTIPDSVMTIEDSAFYGCTGLTRVTIPESVTSIAESAFAWCSSLARLTVERNNPVYFSSGDCVIHRAAKTLVIGCMNSDIPADGSVTVIGGRAFDGRVGLTRLTIPDSVTIIEGDAFVGCDGLTRLIVPDSVTSIGSYAFFNCSGLTGVVIPAGLTSIGYRAFWNCTALRSISVAAANPRYSGAGNCLIDKESKELIQGCMTSVIPSDGSVIRIGDEAFQGCGLTSVTIPGSVSSIGRRAFYGCEALASVTVSQGVTVVESEAFSRCRELISVSIPDSVRNIDSYAFDGCDKLMGLVVSSGVMKIGNRAVPQSALLYGYDGSYAQQWAKENDRVFLVLGEANVTLTAPAVVNEPTAAVYGFANPGAEVVCSVNGKTAVTAAAAISGKWSASVPLTGVKAGDTVTVKATATAEGKTAAQTAKVIYQPEAVVFRALTVNHQAYSVTVTAANLGAAKQNVTYVPGKPLAFQVKISNSARVEKLFVVSNKNGAKKRIGLTYNLPTDSWFAEGYFDEGNDGYVPGNLTIAGVGKDGKEFDCGVTVRINFLIDPSGFVYETFPSNRLEGVTATVYYRDAQGHELPWNAETADQLNPVTTMADGVFAWVVPEGQWQVRVKKDGYYDAASDWMDVPPEHTDVPIMMVSRKAPEVLSCNVYKDRAEITFSQYMWGASVNTETVSFEGYTGTIVPAGTETEVIGYGPDGEEIREALPDARTFVFTPDKPFSGDVTVRIGGEWEYTVWYHDPVTKTLAERTERESGPMSYTTHRPLETPYVATVTVTGEPKDLTLPQAVTVTHGRTAVMEIAARNAAGRSVSVTCDSANLGLSDTVLKLDKNGKAVLTVTGLMPGAATVTVSLAGTQLTASSAVTIVPQEESDLLTGDVDGDGEITSGDARLALRASVKLEQYEPGSASFLAADVDGSGVIESSDARTILRVSVKLESF